MLEMLMAMPKLDVKTCDAINSAVWTTVALAVCAWLYRAEILEALSNALTRLSCWREGRDARPPRAKVHRRKYERVGSRPYGETTQETSRGAMEGSAASPTRRRCR